MKILLSPFSVPFSHPDYVSMREAKQKILLLGPDTIIFADVWYVTGILAFMSHRAKWTTPTLDSRCVLSNIISKLQRPAMTHSLLT